MDQPALAANLRDRFKVRHLDAKSRFEKNHPHAKKFFDKTGLSLDKIRQHSSKVIAAGALTGALLLSPGRIQAEGLYLPEPIAKTIVSSQDLEMNSSDWLATQLAKFLPPISNAFAQPFLSLQEEKVIGKVIERGTGVRAVANLEGEHLNTVYGYIGAEQHLRRFPLDTIAQHGQLAHVEGMAPGNGGFGYFTGEDGKLSQEEIDREKYYVAVQLMYLPDWNERLRYLVNWYKWRKVIVVDVPSGRAVVAVVGDAGPASWTGKHFGGSPELMDWLGGKKYKKGRVLLYFVDDPENKVPLGPVYNDREKIKPPTLEEFLQGPVKAPSQT